MPAGLQVFDSSGNLVVDITSRLARFVGSKYIDGQLQSDALTDSLLSHGQVWATFQPELIWGFQNMDVSRPIITLPGLGGTTISWMYSSAATTRNIRITGTLFYGIY